MWLRQHNTFFLAVILTDRLEVFQGQNRTELMSSVAWEH